MHIARPSRRVREVIGIAVLVLLALAAGWVLEKVGNRATVLLVVMAFLGLCIGVTNLVTRHR